MTSRSAWKAQERRVAKALGGHRIAMSGAAQEKGRLGDVLHDHFEIECKLRAKLSIYPWFKKNEVNAKETHKIPMLVVREKGARNGDLIVLRMSDFLTIFHQTNMGKVQPQARLDTPDYHADEQVM